MYGSHYSLFARQWNISETVPGRNLQGIIRELSTHFIKADPMQNNTNFQIILLWILSSTFRHQAFIMSLISVFYWLSTFSVLQSEWNWSKLCFFGSLACKANKPKPKPISQWAHFRWSKCTPTIHPINALPYPLLPLPGSTSLNCAECIFFSMPWRHCGVVYIFFVAINYNKVCENISGDGRCLNSFIKYENKN